MPSTTVMAVWLSLAYVKARSAVTSPTRSDLGTLRPQTSSGHRMSLYDDGDQEDAPNNDSKVLGGGIDSSTDDLARFGAHGSPPDRS